MLDRRPLDSRLTRALTVPLVVVLLAITLPACRTSPEKKNYSPDKLYQLASKDLKNGDYGSAIKLYEQLEARYPFSNPSRQTHIDLMYAYYKNREPEQAVDQADQFIRENPAHPRVDYAYYIKGLVWFERNANIIERWFHADLSQRPPIDARKSFQAFETLIKNYPNSMYAADARQRMLFLRNRLANYEIYVADYYLSRGAYVGAINRSKYIIENYDGAPATRRALEIIAGGYDGLGMHDLSANAQAVLKANFPTDDFRPEKKPWWKFWSRGAS